MTVSLEPIANMLRGEAKLRTHSGKVLPGDVFVALSGLRTDGASFIDEAVSRGAAAVVHARKARISRREGVVYAVVDNPARALGALARAAFKTESRLPKIIGITGTNGKTTTAHLLHHLLAANGFSTGLIGTVHVSWPGTTLPATMTTPDGLSLHEIMGRMVADGVEYVVMEVSSHALAQERLAGLPVEVGIFSNLTQDHLDYHHDMDSYFAAKARLFAGDHPGCARGAVSLDDAYGRRLKDVRPELMGYGLGAGDLRGRIAESGTWGMRLRMEYRGREWELTTHLAGKHNASNLLACQSAGLLLGFEPERMLCLEHAAGAPGRLERVPNEQGLDIFVDYAHTPDALEKVSAALKEMGFARLITVFGCGGDRDAGKRPLMGRAVARSADVAVLTSDNPRTEDPESILDQIEPGLAGAPRVIREADRRRAIGLAIENMRPGDALLIAGKGHEDYQIIGTEKRHFSDVETVREFVR